MHLCPRRCSPSSRADVVAKLPHTDPFDRLRASQALVEPLRLLTADRHLAAYGSHVEVLI